MKDIFNKYLAVLAHSKFILLLNIIDKAFSFIIFLILARRFPPEVYGQVVTLFALSSVFITIFDFGLPIYLQREISLAKSSPREIFNKIFSIHLIFFVSYFILSFSYYTIFYHEISFALFIIIAPMLYISSLVNLCNKALSGLGDFRSQYAAFVLPRILVLSTFLIGLNFLGFSLSTLMLVMFGGFVMNLVLIFYYIKKAGISYSPKDFKFSDIRFLLKLSLPAGISVLLNFLYDKIDILLISTLNDFQSAAYYNIGYGLFKASTLSFSFFLVSGFTFVSSISSRKEEVKVFFREHAKLIIAICVTVNLLMFFLADFGVRFLYTDKFINSVIVLKILSLGILAVGLNNLTGVVINGMGYFKIVMYITLYGLVLNIVLNVIFIPRYGIEAASVITVITEYFIFFTEYYYLKKILNK